MKLFNKYKLKCKMLWNLTCDFKSGRFTSPRFMFSRGTVYEYNMVSMSGTRSTPNIFIQATAFEKPKKWSLFSKRQYSVYIKDTNNVLKCGGGEFFISGIMAKQIYNMMLR